MTFWLEIPDLDKLSNAQFEVVGLPAEEHLLVLGPPGSGKTVTMLYRAAALRRQYKVRPERFSIFVYTKALNRYVRQLIDKLGLPKSRFPTFDSWCYHYFSTNLRTSRPELPDGMPDFAKIRKEVWRHLDAHVEDKYYDFILVDEGQDLDENTFKILNRMSHHVSVFGDDNQKLFEAGIGFSKIKRLLTADKQPKVKYFPDGFRCTDFVVQLAAEFVETDQKLAFLQQHPEFVGDRQQPVLYLAKDRVEELNHLVENVQVRLEKSERIAILLPSRSLAPRLLAVLDDFGIEVELPLSIKRESNCYGFPEIDFNTPKVKVLTYPSVKGITLDAVLMPFLERSNFNEKFSDELIQKWIYVGISRTTNWAYFSGRYGDIMFAEKFEKLAKDGYLQIYGDPQNGTPETSPDPAPSPDNDDDLSDLF